jgi:hypothetical protein
MSHCGAGRAVDPSDSAAGGRPGMAAGLAEALP